MQLLLEGQHPPSCVWYCGLEQKHCHHMLYHRIKFGTLRLTTFWDKPRKLWPYSNLCFPAFLLFPQFGFPFLHKLVWVGFLVLAENFFLIMRERKLSRRSVGFQLGHQGRLDNWKLQAGVWRRARGLIGFLWLREGGHSRRQQVYRLQLGTRPGLMCYVVQRWKEEDKEKQTKAG